MRNTHIEKTSVEAIVNWPSKTKINKLDESLESLGKMLCRGTYKQIAAALEVPYSEKALPRTIP